MKPLLINTYDVGGAGKACLRLQEGLLDDHIDVKTLIKKKKDQSSKVWVAPRPTFFQRLNIRIQEIFIKRMGKAKQKYLDSRDPRLELFSFPTSEYHLTSLEAYKQADIINLHWVSSFVDYKRFFETNKKPVVWTLHDMNPFSGGEHYNELYLGMNDKGFPERRVTSSLDRQVQNQIRNLKIEVMSKVDNLTIVTLCDWMAEEVKKSAVFKDFPVHVIPNGINTKVFNLQDKEFCRSQLNLPSQKKILLFVADNMGNERKGFLYLQKALEKLNNEEVLLCAVGKSQKGTSWPQNSMQLGTISDEKTMSLAYGAADVFIIPSLIDNLPNTVVESLMCGTPVIGFPVGGIQNMISHDQNGLLTKEVNVDSLFAAIQSFLNSPVKLTREEIRSQAMSKYDSAIQVQAYKSLFQDILDAKTI